MSQTQHHYPIGTPNTPWTDKEKHAWYQQTSVKRSYQQQVLDKLENISSTLVVVDYGALDIEPSRYPLKALKSKVWDEGKPTILITGGVHGYETSGVQGALLFASDAIEKYASEFNFLIAPCVSPWGYETINRWNPHAIDPNRSFYPDSPAQESASLMALVTEHTPNVFAHIDLHETTDTDESEFRPALAARDGKSYIEDNVPDGFYLVGDTDNPNEAFQSAIIQAVEKVTHIAPPDADNKIIGSPIVQHGVINYPTKSLGLCSGLSNCQYGTTTEVYPDSPKVTEQECNLAQVAAICGGLDYLLAQ
ncbi:M14 family metallocarboxypeptidase [Vibrio sp. SCSIO 43136]|uniref:M14 family metallopeptidase n=1 Tax=Vibrio sp. SCSIO 43136 TaxID=2819101 RepID=UPI002074E167|nr:M14 family metallocarboxypeptidase [Vibrio sp. SCSIO 43136]USD67970.1 M14 family metallocarboxypeptidase [Vibrio sp. SCSIO 43136]